MPWPRAPGSRPPAFWVAAAGVCCLAAASSAALFEILDRYLNGPAPAPDKEAWGTWVDGLDGSSGTPSDAKVEQHEAEIQRIIRLADVRVGRHHVILVRHAQPSGDADPKSSPLSAEGLKQAQLTGQRLLEQFGEVDLVVHPGSPEAKATAQVISAAFAPSGAKAKLLQTELLDEGIPVLPSPAPAALEGLEASELAADLSRAEGALRAFTWRPSAEQPDQLRVEVLVGHGNVLRYLICRALQLPPTAWSRFSAHHCTVTWLDISPDGSVALREFGGAGHLPPELITYV